MLSYDAEFKTENAIAADYAVNRVFRNYASALRRLENPMLAERAEDVLDIEKQLLHATRGL